jgi:hypothetical protein
MLGAAEINAILLDLADKAIENIPLIIRENKKDLAANAGDRSEV